jgi:hypothetical protein
MENLLRKFDFDIEELPANMQRYTRREISFLERKFINLFSQEKVKDICDTLSGIGEYQEFIDHIIHLFIELTRLQVILKTNSQPTSFLNLVFADYLFTNEFNDIYYSAIFQNVTKLFLIFAVDKPKKMNEIFLSFCRVFSEDVEFLKNIMTKTLIQQNKVFLEMQYPEYKISRLLEESLSK